MTPHCDVRDQWGCPPPPDLQQRTGSLTLVSMYNYRCTSTCNPKHTSTCTSAAPHHIPPYAELEELLEVSDLCEHAIEGDPNDGSQHSLRGGGGGGGGGEYIRDPTAYNVPVHMYMYRYILYTCVTVPQKCNLHVAAAQRESQEPAAQRVSVKRR